MPGMTDATEQPQTSEAAPVTGHEEIDAALAALDLGDDVHAHPEAISEVLDVLQSVLRDPLGE